MKLGNISQTIVQVPNFFINRKLRSIDTFELHTRTESDIRFNPNLIKKKNLPFKQKIRSELDLESNRFKINENNIYEISIKNNGKKEWPRDTQIIPIQEASINCFKILLVGKVEVGNNKNISLKFDELKIIKEKYCRTVFTLYSETLNNKNDKFLFPCELHFYKADSEEEMFDIDFLD